MDLVDQSVFRRQQVSNFRSSGMTAVAWCSENNMKVSTLRYWLNKFKHESQVDDHDEEVFIEFKHQESIAKETPLIIKIGAVSIELYPGFKAESLREAIAAIRSI
ncbi:MAG: IS66 family insertion sequence element accessory protein TnpA [Desulfitobacterium sp.]